ncbi:single-stranded DNA-binding protein [Nonomuraea turcica]|uniref:single-stranded DNA-binding protein n=1 Tax=Nonomuraea sp. G32 TaxID=3067274 RepID=UPI00273BAAE9|nr:single-stranded DNA-binding protein [Nonomuraea sp. G32]MDP4510295.1 single-stranded DNA-binding protein [Nonomuraea sp. G32]
MDIQISITGRIAFEPRFFPVSNNAPAMWAATLEVNGPPTPGRGGSAYIPTRHVEVVTYGVAAIRASQSYRKGHVIVVQGCDLIARSYDTKDRANKPIVRAVIKITATAIGLCSRYDVVSEAETAWPPAGTASPRMVQGGTPTTTEVPAAAAA